VLCYPVAQLVAELLDLRAKVKLHGQASVTRADPER
jgi:hypothetical protein